MNYWKGLNAASPLGPYFSGEICFCICERNNRRRESMLIYIVVSIGYTSSWWFHILHMGSPEHWFSFMASENLAYRIFIAAEWPFPRVLADIGWCVGPGTSISVCYAVCIKLNTRKSENNLLNRGKHAFLHFFPFAKMTKPSPLHGPLEMV